MPVFGGANIFGASVAMITNDRPRAVQINAFFGINGVEALDGGSRGRYTDVTGVLSGVTAAGLASAEALFRSFEDGIPRTLVDTYGASWPNATLEAFAPQGRVRQSPYGYFFRPYRARFFHHT